MAKNNTPTSKDTIVVTRVKATDTRESKKTAKKTTSTVEPTPKAKERKNPLKATGGYFVGAWQELRQVRWPTRRATWGLTAAVMGFTAFFVIVILLLDALFKYVFQLILG